MDFYTLDYIISQQSTDWTMRVISILALLLVCLVFSVLYRLFIIEGVGVACGVRRVVAG